MDGITNTINQDSTSVNNHKIVIPRSASIGPRIRKSRSPADRITRFASPNKFDVLQAPLSFLDSRKYYGENSRKTFEALQINPNIPQISRAINTLPLSGTDDNIDYVRLTNQVVTGRVYESGSRYTPIVFQPRTSIISRRQNMPPYRFRSLPASSIGFTNDPSSSQTFTARSPNTMVQPSPQRPRMSSARRDSYTDRSSTRRTLVKFDDEEFLWSNGHPSDTSQVTEVKSTNAGVSIKSVKHRHASRKAKQELQYQAFVKPLFDNNPHRKMAKESIHTRGSTRIKTMSIGPHRPNTGHDRPSPIPNSRSMPLSFDHSYQPPPTKFNIESAELWSSAARADRHSTSMPRFDCIELDTVNNDTDPTLVNELDRLASSLGFPVRSPRLKHSKIPEPITDAIQPVTSAVVQQELPRSSPDSQSTAADSFKDCPNPLTSWLRCRRRRERPSRTMTQPIILDSPSTAKVKPDLSPRGRSADGDQVRTTRSRSSSFLKFFSCRRSRKGKQPIIPQQPDASASYHDEKPPGPELNGIPHSHTFDACLEEPRASRTGGLDVNQLAQLFATRQRPLSIALPISPDWDSSLLGSDLLTIASLTSSPPLSNFSTVDRCLESLRYVRPRPPPCYLDISVNAFGYGRKPGWNEFTISPGTRRKARENTVEVQAKRHTLPFTADKQPTQANGHPTIGDGLKLQLLKERTTETPFELPPATEPAYSDASSLNYNQVLTPTYSSSSPQVVRRSPASALKFRAAQLRKIRQDQEAQELNRVEKFHEEESNHRLRSRPTPLGPLLNADQQNKRSPSEEEDMASSLVDSAIKSSLEEVEEEFMRGNSLESNPLISSSFLERTKHVKGIMAESERQLDRLRREQKQTKKKKVISIESTTSWSAPTSPLDQPAGEKQQRSVENIELSLTATERQLHRIRRNLQGQKRKNPESKSLPSSPLDQPAKTADDDEQTLAFNQLEMNLTEAERQIRCIRRELQEQKKTAGQTPVMKQRSSSGSSRRERLSSPEEEASERHAAEQIQEGMLLIERQLSSLLKRAKELAIERILSGDKAVHEVVSGDLNVLVGRTEMLSKGNIARVKQDCADFLSGKKTSARSPAFFESNWSPLPLVLDEGLLLADLEGCQALIDVQVNRLKSQFNQFFSSHSLNDRVTAKGQMTSRSTGYLTLSEHLTALPTRRPAIESQRRRLYSTPINLKLETP